jgi:hypothetical protein
MGKFLFKDGQEHKYYYHNSNDQNQYTNLLRFITSKISRKFTKMHKYN